MTETRTAAAQAHDRIVELAALEPGWLDGHGARPTDEATSAAHDLVNLIGADIAAFAIFPREEGGLSFESMPHSYEGFREIETNADGTTNLFAADRRVHGRVVYIEGTTVADAKKFLDDPFAETPADSQLYTATLTDGQIYVHRHPDGELVARLPETPQLATWARDMDGSLFTSKAAPRALALLP